MRKQIQLVSNRTNFLKNFGKDQNRVLKVFLCLVSVVISFDMAEVLKRPSLLQWISMSSVFICLSFHVSLSFQQILGNCSNIPSMVAKNVSTASIFVDPRIYVGIDGRGLTYTTWNKLMSVALWEMYYNAISAQMGYLPYEDGFSWTNAPRYCWGYLLGTSHWPSDWGWYAVVILSLVPCSWNKAFPYLLRKIGSQLVIMLFGNRWCLEPMLVKRSAALLAKQWGGNIPKCAYFERRSMNIIMTVFPWYAGNLTCQCLPKLRKNVESATKDPLH